MGNLGSYKPLMGNLLNPELLQRYLTEYYQVSKAVSNSQNPVLMIKKIRV